MSETSRFAQVHLGKLDETAVNHDDDDDDEGGDDPDAFFKLVSKLPYFFCFDIPSKNPKQICNTFPDLAKNASCIQGGAW